VSDFNDVEVIKSIENLLNSFVAQRYYEADRDEIRTLLERTRNLIKKRFGEASGFLQQLQMVQFIYPRAKQKNAVAYFKRDKQTVVSLLNSIIDELRASAPTSAGQSQEAVAKNPFFVSYTRSNENYATQVISQVKSWGYF
jgi:hypothetical protein